MDLSAISELREAHTEIHRFNHIVFDHRFLITSERFIILTYSDRHEEDMLLLVYLILEERLEDNLLPPLRSAEILHLIRNFHNLKVEE